MGRPYPCQNIVQASTEDLLYCYLWFVAEWISTAIPLHIVVMQRQEIVPLSFVDVDIAALYLCFRNLYLHVTMQKQSYNV